MVKHMKIIDIWFESFSTLIISFNWIALIAACLLIVAIGYLFKLAMKHLNKKSVVIDEVSLGIGNNTITLKYDKKDKEIAYKLWVELSTRKIAIPFDIENDVIDEVYDSWYNFFGTARELLKEIPWNHINNSTQLISLTERVLNHGLRPHLTMWQAKYRKWYKQKITEPSDLPPQKIQKSYEKYDELVADILQTNEKLIFYKDLMYKIAFDK